jgi:SepF-like predicted cell division protein (DUF552 family)
MRFKKFLDKFSSQGREDDEYLEIDLTAKDKKEKVMVKPFLLKKFEDVNEILNSLREGYNIVVIDIKPLKTKDVMDLKRAIAKIKKTTEALEGDIAGFGDSMIIATPNFAEIYKPKQQPKKEKREESY